MSEYIRALLLHSQETRAAALILALKEQLIKSERAFTLREAAARLAGANPPHLVLTDTELFDGIWSDVLDLTDRASQPINVIVVSPTADIPLYIDVMERGAFDFITHSFTAPELTHILRCARDNVIRRRREQDRFTVTKLGCVARPINGRKEDLNQL